MSNIPEANRREDMRLITGQGRYTADFNLPGQLHAAFFRSDRAHAEILLINVVSALERPGVVAIFTGDDAVAAGYVQLPHLMDFTNRAGAGILKPERPVLAYGKVRYVGEAVAMIVAETAQAAQDALDAIQVKYGDLEASVTVGKALAERAPRIHDDVPGNVSFEWDIGDEDAVAQAFARAEHVTRLKVVSQRVTASPIEPRACLASYDEATGSFDIYTCAQGITFMRWQFATLTGLPDEKLRFHMYDVGGSFGQRSGAYPEYGAQLIAAKRLGRPIKWVSSRAEGFLTDCHGRAMHITCELAMDREGRFLAGRYDFVCDMGAYLTPTAPNSHIRNPAIAMTGVYRIPALHGKFRLAFTNTAPVASYRGAGRPDIAFAVERLVDEAAAEMGIDRDELRRRNFIPPDAFPYKTPTMGVYERADFAGCLDKALKAADWGGFTARRDAAAKSGKLRGIGLATVIEGTGRGRFPVDQVAIKFEVSGSLVVYALSLSSGQGHETTFPEIMARTLGIAPERITLRESVQGMSLTGNPTGGSRSLVSVGSACKIAAEQLIERARRLAAETLGVEPSQLDYASGEFRVRASDKAIGLFELADQHRNEVPHPLNLIAEGKVDATFPNGCHIAEVEIDPETGSTHIVSYVAADDCGNVINHTIVEGQIHGGVAQGAGQVLGEQIVYDPASGQLLSGSFGDYFMPRAGMLREVQLIEHAVPSIRNGLGAKGVGESGCTASLPTVANAVMDALRPLGIRHLDTPYTPARVWQSIHGAPSQTSQPS
jgi:aerobic carbon-monoxide dehydrogenase large subunit